VKIKVAWIGKTKDPAIQSLTQEYLKRVSRYAEVEGLEFRDEDALRKFRERRGTRPAYTLGLLDSRGKQVSSEEFARFLDDYAMHNPQALMLAIGPADGFTQETKKVAAFTISLGKITLAHELARIVLLEQLYRAFTILKGHPYHSGH
jgi:23S rRNA (pseudouridine1915-N3)-methyltransferase